MKISQNYNLNKHMTSVHEEETVLKSNLNVFIEVIHFAYFHHVPQNMIDTFNTQIKTILVVLNVKRFRIFRGT